MAFDAGARTEREAENGVAHFLEHMVLRGGPPTYPSYREINTTVQRLGADFDGYVSHDFVAFYITVRVEYAVDAIDLLTAIVSDPALATRELELERDVIADEIASRAERPAVVVDDLLVRALFDNHPLGRPVVGHESVVRGLTAEDLQDFRARRYGAGGGFAVLVANLDRAPGEQDLARALERIPSFRAPQPWEPAPDRPPDRLIDRREGGRSQIRIGYRPAIDIRDPQTRAALRVYCSLLGGSVASRLFADLREERGLCYSVFASDYSSADAAVVKVSAEVNPNHTVEAYDAMREHVERMRDEPPGEDEVVRARQYTAGRRVLALEQTRAVARYAARQWLVYNEPVDAEEAVRSIDSVTVDEVAAIAKAMPTDIALACVGPHDAEQFA